MLDWYGLRFNPPAPDARAKAWLGVDTRVDNGRLLVSALLLGTPAYGSGLASDDELIAIDDFRLDTDGLDARLEQYRTGDSVTVLVSRRGELRRFGLTLGRAPTDQWSLSVSPDATREQQQRLTAWLGDGSEARGGQQ
jgi:predicted metalloprotease with PDZ domain